MLPTDVSKQGGPFPSTLYVKYNFLSSEKSCSASFTSL